MGLVIELQGRDALWGGGSETERSSMQVDGCGRTASNSQDEEGEFQNKIRMASRAQLVA